MLAAVAWLVLAQVAAVADVEPAAAAANDATARTDIGTGCFPLLAPGTAWGVSYTPGTNTSGLWNALLAKGLAIQQLSLPCVMRTGRHMAA